jgi:hypothetical protein
MERNHEGILAERIHDITILCVTNGNGNHIPIFLEQMRRNADVLDAYLLIGTDGEHGYRAAIDANADMIAPVRSNGYLESILDIVMDQVKTQYVLRLDDDEKLSPDLLAWLKQGKYKKFEIITFPRANMWGDEQHFLSEYPWWMDEQTRLGKTELMTGRSEIHQGNPYGAGIIVPYVLEHHKFLVRSYEERRRIAEQYEQVKSGAGLGEYLPYNLPEDTGRKLVLSQLGSGYKEGFIA